MTLPNQNSPNCHIWPPKRPRNDTHDSNENSTDSAFDELINAIDIDELLASTSNISDPLYGLSNEVRTYLREERGIEKLYEWQERCLLRQLANPGRNLIISLPTSGGKTLMAEIMILKTVLFQKRDALLILPFVSIVQEKIKGLQRLGLDFDFHVEEYAASRGRIPPIKRRRKKSIYVATIEKSQLLINSLIESKRIDALGIVIIDELHMLGEGRNRGATLEKVITTLKVAARSTQLVGLSATLSNMDELKEFLNADVFSSDYRPIPLTEYVKLGNTVYKVRQSGGSCFGEILELDRRMDSKTSDDPDGVCNLVLEVIPQASCLIFCSTKKNAERVAALLSKALPRDLEKYRMEDKKQLLHQLKAEVGCDPATGSMCPILRGCIKFGIAYHHSGLTTDERNLLQEAFLNGVLCVICCTSTLAAGVNLPARRVILRNPLIGNEFLSKQQYKQMVGRAGRAGLDSSGESFLIINGKQLSQALQLLQKDVETCDSSLLRSEDVGDLEQYLLNVIKLELVKCRSELDGLITQTLAFIQRKRTGDNVADRINTAFNNLVSARLLELQSDGNGQEQLIPTKLGCATVESGFDTRTAQDVHRHLSTSTQYLALSTHLHLLYCVIPLWDQMQDLKVNWDVFYDEYCKLDEPERKVFELLSISEAYLLKRKRGVATKTDLDDVAIRLYSALIIWRLWKGQESIWSVSERYLVSRGIVQSLSKECSASASALLRYVEHLDEFWALKLLLPDITKRLAYCVKSELIPLMEIQGVKQGRANQLYQAGFKSLRDIVDADVRTLISSIDHLSRRQAQQIIASAKMLRNEKMEIILEQAKEIIADPDDPNADDTAFDFLTKMSQ